VNSLINRAFRYKNTILCFCLLLSSFAVLSQQNNPSISEFTIADITVTGQTAYGAETILTYSGLRKGETVIIPGSVKISAAIKKLWDSNLFSSIEVFATKTEGRNVYLEVALNDLPELKEVKIVGVKKGKVKEIIDENNLTSGVKVTENLITTTKNYLESKYRKLGFLNTKATVTTTKVIDSVAKSRVDMLVRIDKGQKIKIKSIAFTGADKLSAKKLRKAMKNTKQKNPLRVLKRSKSPPRKTILSEC